MTSAGVASARRHPRGRFARAWDARRVRRRAVGLASGATGAVAMVAVMLPLRADVNVSTVTLIFIIPAIAAEIVGGVLAGFATVALSALVLDFFFIPPYGTLSIGSAQNWVGLGVYLVVVGLVAVVVGRSRAARGEAERNALNIRRVYELSELLVQDRSEGDLLISIVDAVQRGFDVEAVSLLVLEDAHLRVAASVGPALTSEEMDGLDPLPGRGGRPVSMSAALAAPSELRTVSLAAAGRPIGVLALKGAQFSEDDRELLVTFANDAAIAMERAQLRELALRTALLEELDRLRHALMGAVSHDLRTPLATIKVASSTLVTRGRQLSADDAHELHQLIEIESDRLTRLVTNLLDMTRIEAGVLTVRRHEVTIAALVGDALNAMRSTLSEHRVVVDVAESLPSVDIDRVLMVQVLVNLLDNAGRHSAPASSITVSGDVRDGTVVLAVSDEGPGVAKALRSSVFDRFSPSGSGERSGLGLTIAKTFVEAHGERIWYEPVPGGGARFVFSLPRAAMVGR